MQTEEAVSYTHLDVYKRQTVNDFNFAVPILKRILIILGLGDINLVFFSHPGVGADTCSGFSEKLYTRFEFKSLLLINILSWTKNDTTVFWAFLHYDYPVEHKNVPPLFSVRFHVSSVYSYIHQLIQTMGTLLSSFHIFSMLRNSPHFGRVDFI